MVPGYIDLVIHPIIMANAELWKIDVYCPISQKPTVRISLSLIFTMLGPHPSEISNKKYMSGLFKVMGGDVLHKLFWPPPSGIPIFCGVPPYRIANFLGPPTRRIYFTFFVENLLQKVEKDHPPTESQNFPDYPPCRIAKIFRPPSRGIF